MARSRRDHPVTADDGSAALEFILAGMLLLVPLVYLIVTLGLIQGRALGVETAAREVARVVALSPDAATARDRTNEVLRSVVSEYGMDAGRVEVSFACHPESGPCPRAGATLVVTVATHVALPLVPPVLGLDRASEIGVVSSAAQKMSRVWGAG